MKKSYKVAIIPAYNEEQRIGLVLHTLKKYVDTIIVVDDGSTDKTSEKCNINGVVLMKHAINLGQGAALQTGFDFAKKLNPDVVITFDADGQFEAKEIQKIISPIIHDDYDIVLGSRFLGSTTNMPLSRWIILKLGIVFTYLFSGILLTDTHNGFRAFNNKTLHTIYLHQNRMSYASELIDQIKQYNLRYKEVPVTIKYDSYTLKKGQKNYNAINIIINLLFEKLT